MLHELRAYDLRPGAGPGYLALFLEAGIGAVTRHLPMAGYWLTDTGALNRLYHLWIYESLAERAAARLALGQDADWTEGFVPRGFPLILRQQNALMELVEGSPALAAAERERRAHHPNLGPGAAVFAATTQALTEGPARPDAPLVGRWRVISGAGPGRLVTLWSGADPLASAPGALRHEVLRPLSCSPLR